MFRFGRSALSLFGRLALLGFVAATAAVAGASPVRIVPGAGSFVFFDDYGDPSRPITVYSYVPRQIRADTAGILFTMHGAHKDAKGMRDTWVRFAEQNGIIVLAPQFDPEFWPGTEYAYAGVVDKDGRPGDIARWTSSAIENLFDAVKAALGNTTPRYSIYGHSEGGQFVHRLVLMRPEARFDLAVAANPGWYLMPRFDLPFPYGLRNSTVTEESLARSLTRDFVLLLGDKDTDPAHPQLNKSARAMAQGPHRFARGQNFMREAQRQAAQMKLATAWRMQAVPGASHQNAVMAKAAAAFLATR